MLFLSNPNNPTGAVLPPTTLAELAEMCAEDDVFVVMDQLYCRQVYTGAPFTHLRALPGMRTRCVTLTGPSRTESLSGYRIGTAVALAVPVPVAVTAGTVMLEEDPVLAPAAS